MKQRLLAAGVGTEKRRSLGRDVPCVRPGNPAALRRADRAAGEIKLLDTLDAVTLLENHLAELNLDALDNLYNPAIHLGGILRQIGRAKDELCPPERYAELCRAMQAAAEAEADGAGGQARQDTGARAGRRGQGRGKRQKSGEVARCYAVYERLLRENGFLDFGDLIGRTAALLEDHPDVLATLAGRVSAGAGG